VAETPSAPATNMTATSSSPATSTSTPTTTTTVTTTTGATNTLTSGAQTGNAQVTENTTVGNTNSGDATAQTTVINTVQSSVQGDTTGIAHFTADINGNVTGDITLAPTINGALSQSGSTVPVQNLQVNNSTGLTNNIDLSATSGNVDVSKNTTAGDATTGNANTVASIVNLINSIIAANQSFVGTINIYGNLNGDILVSPDFIPQLLASNAPNATLGPVANDLTSVNNQSIINNINLQATSGDAQATANTNVGNVSTGNAQTNLTVLNLTGHEVVASNSLLVFVNVLGKWVGMIVNAPGATAAELGNGVISNTVNPLSQLSAQNNSQIVNNISLASQSGDANAFGNTTVGDVSTGNASASANIANINMSSFSLSKWFGVLFINVFGTWYGSFGINTASGEVVPIDPAAVPVNASQMGGSPAVQLGFTPRTFATQHKNTSPLYTPLSTGTVHLTGVYNTSQDQPTVVTTAAVNDLTDGGVGDAMGTRSVVVPASAGIHTVSPIAYALMATGVLGMTAPVLTSLNRRHSIHFKK
jgi:hypothetical protein